MTASPRSHVTACILFSLVLAGCAGGQPANVVKSADLEGVSYTRIAVLPFMRGLGLEQSAPIESAEIFEGAFLEAADEVEGYTFRNPPMIQSVLGKREFSAGMEAFEKSWLTDREPNRELLDRIGERLEVDAVMVGVVDVWQKYTIGLTLFMIRISDGKVLWEAGDEYYGGGLRTETSSRIYGSDHGTRMSSGDINDETRDAFDEMARQVVGNILEHLPPS